MGAESSAQAHEARRLRSFHWGTVRKSPMMIVGVSGLSIEEWAQRSILGISCQKPFGLAQGDNDIDARGQRVRF